jgi:hypothetical protein
VFIKLSDGKLINLNSITAISYTGGGEFSQTRVHLIGGSTIDTRCHDELYNAMKNRLSWYDAEWYEEKHK